MGSGRNFGHNAAKCFMLFQLRKNTVSQNARAVAVSSLRLMIKGFIAYKGHGGFIAARFNS
jgi:hypothetical protein